MSMTYLYDVDSNIVNATATGVVVLRQLQAYTERVLADPFIAPGFIEVVDLERVTDLGVTYGDLASFGGVWKQYLEKGCHAAIFFAPTDLSYGTFRMLQAVIGLSDAESADRVMVLRRKDDVVSTIKRLRRGCSARS